MRRGGKPAAEVVKALVDIGTAHLSSELSIDKGQAHHAMREIAHQLSKQYGGAAVYFAKDQEFGLTQRDMDIYRDLGHLTAREVALKNGISDRQVYAINSYVTERLKRDQQPALPGIDD